MLHHGVVAVDATLYIETCTRYIGKSSDAYIERRSAACNNSAYGKGHGIGIRQ